MLPFGDTPFEDYIKTRATANQTEFAQVLKNAEQRVDPVNYRTDKSKSPTLYIALRDDADAKELDLSKFFPDINVSDIKILKKRNDILLKELYKQSKGALKKGLDLQGGVSFTLEIDDKNLQSDEQMRKGQLDDVLTVMNNRINGLGVTEPTIRVVGGKSIEVQMPGVSLKDNPESIEELSRPAKLEFRLVHRTLRPSSVKPLPSEIPAGYEVLVMENERGGNQPRCASGHKTRKGCRRTYVRTSPCRGKGRHHQTRISRDGRRKPLQRCDGIYIGGCKGFRAHHKRDSRR